MADLPTTRVVIDCDTGVDDTMAVFYGLLAPHIDVVGLTCVWGNIGVDLTTTNTLRLLEMLGRPEIPVARGAEKPLLGPEWPHGQGVHGADGQGNLNLPPPSLKPVKETAVRADRQAGPRAPGRADAGPDRAADERRDGRPGRPRDRDAVQEGRADGRRVPGPGQRRALGRGEHLARSRGRPGGA